MPAFISVAWRSFAICVNILRDSDNISVVVPLLMAVSAIDKKVFVLPEPVALQAIIDLCAAISFRISWTNFFWYGLSCMVKKGGRSPQMG